MDVELSKRKESDGHGKVATLATLFHVHGRLFAVGGTAMVLAMVICCSAAAHDWYEDLLNRHGNRCCSGHDCRPVDLCLRPNRVQGLLIHGVCVAIPWDKVLPIPSPDGQAHVCTFMPPMNYAVLPYIRCVILPGSV